MCQESTAEKIQIVDVSRITKENPTQEDYKIVGESIHKAFVHLGFAYIQNHGVEKETIENAFGCSMDFFNLPTEVKERTSKGLDLQGWVKEGSEIFDQDENGQIAEHEVRETYDMKNISGGGIFPDTDCPPLRPALTKLTEASVSLTSRLLKALSVALDQELDYFDKMHIGMMAQGRIDCPNATTLRSLHYPPISSEMIKPGIIRCGEHSDYGTITLLYQDSMGGLEVKSVDNKWVQATPIPGTILINVGDLLENLSGGEYPATRHRVKIPQEELRRKCRRQSIAFFVHPDDHVLIEPLEGPNEKYKPITAIQHLANRFAATYGDDFNLSQEK